MAVKPNVRLLGSHISHMAFLLVWRDSGVTQEHGFDMTVHVTARDVPGQPFLTFPDRAPKLLSPSYPESGIPCCLRELRGGSVTRKIPHTHAQFPRGTTDGSYSI